MTNARLTDRLAVSVKDQIRSAHFQVKRRARSAASGAAPTPMFSQQVAKAADVIIGRFESTAAKIFSSRTNHLENAISFGTISTYFFENKENGWSFASEIYHMTDVLLRRFSQSDGLVFESSVVELYVRMMERHVAQLDSCMTIEARDISLCAALAVEFASLRPIKAWILKPDQISAPRHFFIAPNQYVAFVIAVSIAVKSRASSRREANRLGDEEIVNLVDLSVDALFADLSGALKSRNSVEVLTAMFSETLPFIG